MIAMDVVVANGPTVELIANENNQEWSVRTLPELAAFINDHAARLSVAQLELLGRLAAVLASLDPATTVPRDVTSLGKIIDAHDFATGSPANSRAFGSGEWTAVRQLRQLSSRPDADEVRQILQVA